MDETKIEIGGNSALLWYGRLLARVSKYYTRRSEYYANRSETLIENGNKTIITNPSSKFINPFTLLLTFTVDNNKKYQLITQGDYKVRYKVFSEKEKEEKETPLDNHEMFILIKTHQKDWFLKE